MYTKPNKFLNTFIFFIYIPMAIISCSVHMAGGGFVRVNIATDFNDDGIADALVGAINDDDGGANAGAAYVFYGAASLASSIDASAAGVKLIGEVAGDQFGFSVASGDVNNDGIADMVVGANLEDAGGASAGAVYVFFGSITLPTSIDASNANVKLVGEDAGDQFGISVATGDVNADGIADIIVGAINNTGGAVQSGSAYIFYGDANIAQSIDASAANVKLNGQAGNDQFGRSVSSGGDVNSDGVIDVVVGADQEDAGGSQAGAAYVFYGSRSLASTINASAANVKIIGENANDTLGISLANISDVNADGIPDILVGAHGFASGGTAIGAAYVVYGSRTLASSIDASAANVKIVGEDLGNLGNAVATGDVNYDGIADIIVGDSIDEEGGAANGTTYIFYGSRTLAALIDASAANVKLIGEDDGDDFGVSVASIGDINNDGIADIISGADFEDAGGANSGAAYIFYGSTSLAASIDASAANVKLVGEDAGDQFGTYVAI